MTLKEIETVATTTFPTSPAFLAEKAFPNFRLGGHGARFSAKSRGAARKTNISAQCRAGLTFQSSARASIQGQKPRNPRPDIEWRCIYPKTTRFHPPPPSHPCPTTLLLSRDARRRLFRICARANPTMGPPNIYFLGPRPIRERTPLNLV